MAPRERELIRRLGDPGKAVLVVVGTTASVADITACLRAPHERVTGPAYQRNCTRMCPHVARAAAQVRGAREATVRAVSVETIFSWRPGPVPVGVPVAQVYGWLLDDVGRVLVQDVGGRFNLPGGSPESCDGEDLVATLRREAMEESQVTVVDAVPLGFEEVRRDGRPTAFVRMVGRIGQLLPRQADPDGGRLFRRLMTSLDAAPVLLGWGASGRRQAVAAALVAGERWDLPACSPRVCASYAD